MVIENGYILDTSCTDWKSYIITAREGDIIYPFYESDTAKYFIRLDSIINDSTVIIECSQYTINDRLTSIIDVDLLDETPTFILNTNDLLLTAQAWYPKNSFYLRVDSTSDFYRLNKSNSLPIVTDVTDVDDPSSWLLYYVSKNITGDTMKYWTEKIIDDCIHVKDGIYKEWQYEGKKIKDCLYKNGKLNGLYREWHRNGKPYIRGEYKNGFRNGTWTYFNLDGDRMNYGRFESGTGFIYYMDGTPKEEDSYRDGLMDGYFRIWYPNGNMRSEVFFKEGKRIGVEKSWLEDGTLQKEMIHSVATNNPISIEYYPNGNISKIRTYDDETGAQIIQEWYSYGQPKKVYMQTRWNWPLRTWDENGQLRSFRIFQKGTNNKKDSVAIEWYPNGRMKSKRLFVPGEDKYILQSWHNNGQLSSQGDERQKAKIGIWQYWDSEGNLIKEENYDSNK